MHRICWFTPGSPVGPGTREQPSVGSCIRTRKALSSGSVITGSLPIPTSPTAIAAGRECWGGSQPSSCAAKLSTIANPPKQTNVLRSGTATGSGRETPARFFSPPRLDIHRLTDASWTVFDSIASSSRLRVSSELATGSTFAMATVSNSPSAFDGHHPPSTDIVDQCVHCGFCLPVCPTYVLWGQEMDSPRGRIYLMKLAAEGAAQINPPWVSHFDRCLGCMACMSACPSGVDYGKLIEATRAQIERNFKRPWGEKRHRHFLFETLTRPDRLHRLRAPLLAYQKSGLQAMARGLGLIKLLPKKWQTMEALLPRLTPQEAVLEVMPAVGTKRRRVGLLLGCVQRAFFSQVNAATARVLAREGCEVVAPQTQACCGALLVHAGEEAAAIDLAKKTMDAFERANVETIVTNAAGCGSNLKEYGHRS